MPLHYHNSISLALPLPPLHTVVPLLPPPVLDLTPFHLHHSKTNNPNNNNKPTHQPALPRCHSYYYHSSYLVLRILPAAVHIPSAAGLHSPAGEDLHSTVAAVVDSHLAEEDSHLVAGGSSVVIDRSIGLVEGIGCLGGFGRRVEERRRRLGRRVVGSLVCCKPLLLWFMGGD